ncbi:hypothetical protein C8R45DRAFT_995856 [Mycena sanguinolenta]|nr:hypothetical protein C8R45DRAFT_995856 [Mycena sanguinolenta]
MTTTICSFPNELLVAISLAGQEDRVAETSSSGSQWQTRSAGTFKSEWILSRLSQRFRRVIIGAPSLWTLAEADLDDEGSVEVLKLYLERSRACEISITLRQSLNSGLEYDLLLKRVESSIPAHFNRVRRLRIAVRKWRKALENIFCDAAAPCLDHLELVNLDRRSVATCTIFSSGAPKLNFLRVEKFKLGSSAAPWTASLTHLELLQCPVHTQALPPITTQCPRLVRLHLDTYLHTDAAPVHIPTLEFLHISIVTEETAQYLLGVVDLFDMPALTELRIEGSHGDQIGVLFNSTAPRHASFPALTTVVFVYRGKCRWCDASSGFSYPPIAQSPSPLFPALASLTLVNECFTPSLIRHLLGSGMQPWPFLSSVAVHLYDYSEEDEEFRSLQDVRSAFEDAEDARRQRADPLPRVALFRSRSSFRDWDADRSDSADTILEVIW